MEELGNRSVDEWIGNIAEKKCGWAEKQYELALRETAERALDHEALARVCGFTRADTGLLGVGTA